MRQRLVGTLASLARAIRNGGGDYCMALKKNWPAVHAGVEQLFSEPPDDVAFETVETVDLTGGRIETEVERGDKIERETRY
jgi:hypothetical protein